MEIEQVLIDGTTVLYLKGKLDTVTATKLESHIAGCLGDGITTFQLDFEQLRFVSSAGLRVLLSTQKKINRIKGSLVLSNVSNAIREIFDITGFSGVLTLI